MLERLLSPDLISVSGWVIGTLGLLLTAFVAWHQQIQLRRLEEIGHETRETARKITADSYAENVVRKLFGLDYLQNKQYSCLFPVNYERKPLPYIAAGDYNSLHVLQNLLGVENLKIEMVSQNHSQDANAPDVKTAIPSKNIIYLCTPNANSALALRAPAVQITNNQSTPIPKFDDTELPCWFATETHTTENTTHTEKKIFIINPNQILSSGAEADYANASKLKTGEPYQPISTIQSDLGIFMRFSAGRSRIFVIAGIHQYGTWIVSDLVEKLVNGTDVIGREVFEGLDDFIAIIYGEFNSADFTVQTSEVQTNYIWVRNNRTWERYKPPVGKTP
jgi:hypothetical protein